VGNVRTETSAFNAIRMGGQPGAERPDDTRILQLPTKYH
jgi:hypothetical protein